MLTLHSFFLELKFRMFYIILSLILTFVISYNFQIEIVYIVGKPFLEFQKTFVFFELTEALYTLLRISTILALLTNFPFLIYHIWSFFIPSFYQIERKKTNFFCILSLNLFISEILFSYFILLPQICHFFLSFEITPENSSSGFSFTPFLSVEFTARIYSYVELVVTLLSIIMVLFQIPLCIYFLYSKKVLNVSNFYRNRKLFYFISILVAAFIVPPDVFSQLILVLVFFLVFELLIFIGLFFE